jgi:hypothetical protein
MPPPEWHNVKLASGQQIHNDISFPSQHDLLFLCVGRTIESFTITTQETLELFHGRIVLADHLLLDTLLERVEDSLRGIWLRKDTSGCLIITFRATTLRNSRMRGAVRA